MAQGARVMPRVVSRSDLLKIGLFSVIEVDTKGGMQKKRPVFIVFFYEGGGGRPKSKKTMELFFTFCFLLVCSSMFLDPQNMFYTWSGVPMSYLQQLGQLQK